MIRRWTEAKKHRIGNEHVPKPTREKLKQYGYNVAAIAFMTLLPLPSITAEPAKYYGSCTFLSTDLLRALRHILPKAPDFTLSVGSGIGLLEALFARYRPGISADARPDLCIECVEVSSFRSERKYIAEDSIHYVQGTWQTSLRAREAKMWIFVFPRDPALLEKYVTDHVDGKVEHILWIGPRDDFSGYKNSVKHAKFKYQTEFGEGILQRNEMGWLWSRTQIVNSSCLLPYCPLHKDEVGIDLSAESTLDIDNI